MSITGASNLTLRPKLTGNHAQLQSALLWLHNICVDHQRPIKTAAIPKLILVSVSSWSPHQPGNCSQRRPRGRLHLILPFFWSPLLLIFTLWPSAPQALPSARHPRLFSVGSDHHYRLPPSFNCAVELAITVYFCAKLENILISSPKHRKNCECCPGHYPIVNKYYSISWFKFHNLSAKVNCVTKSLIHQITHNLVIVVIVVGAKNKI